VVKLLLRRGADIDVRDKANRTAAELASENHETEVANFLAGYREDTNTRENIASKTLEVSLPASGEDGEDMGNASLLFASKYGEVATVKSLLDWGADIGFQDEDYCTPLHLAALYGNLGVVRLLVEREADVDPRDRFGWTPLHYASVYGFVEISRALVEHGANVNAWDPDHWTPIHFATFHGRLDVVKFLLGCNADAHVLNDDEESPYQVSLSRGYQEITNLLRRYGAGKE
jgi:ankyrin repeat protein